MSAPDKNTAVVLAGGNRGFSFREFYHQLEDFIAYREWYFRIGFKSLKRIRRKGRSDSDARPMVEYILRTLQKIDCIDRVLVVGPEAEMREKLDPELIAAGSKIELVQQKDSFGQNVKTGYDLAGQQHVLFVTADSPTTRAKDIMEFVEICRSLHDQYDLIYPLVKESLLKVYYRLFPRPVFKMMPDTIIPENYIQPWDLREDGRVGFRITSMACVNLENFPVERIDEAYRLRKVYRKSSRVRLKEIFGKNLFRRYLRGMRMSEVEKMVMDYEQLKIKLVGLSGAGSSLDMDSTRDEKKMTDLQF